MLTFANPVERRARFRGPSPCVDDSGVAAATCADAERAVELPSETIATNDGSGRSLTALLPVMAVVSIAFLIIGFALPGLPLHVHRGLGLSPFVVGLVTGSQFAASLFSRVWAGRFADSRGAKRAVVLGLIAAIVSGLLYLVSLAFVSAPWASVSILLAGRALLGGAESFIITGAAAWGLALTG